MPWLAARSARSHRRPAPRCTWPPRSAIRRPGRLPCVPRVDPHEGALTVHVMPVSTGEGGRARAEHRRAAAGQDPQPDECERRRRGSHRHRWAIPGLFCRYTVSTQTGLLARWCRPRGGVRAGPSGGPLRHARLAARQAGRSRKSRLEVHPSRVRPTLTPHGGSGRGTPLRPGGPGQTVSRVPDEQRGSRPRP